MFPTHILLSCKVCELYQHRSSIRQKSCMFSAVYIVLSISVLYCISISLDNLGTSSYQVRLFVKFLGFHKLGDKVVLLA